MVGKICNMFIALCLVVILTVLFVLAIPTLQKNQIFVIETSSMGNTLPINTLVVVETAAPEDVKQNDMITFSSGSTAQTHRVISVQAQQRYFVTKGDANQDIDPEPVEFERLVGRVKYSIPFLGVITRNISTPSGILACAGGFLLLVLLFVFPSFFEKDDSVEAL